MLSPFWGEFLVSPIPLELGMSYCSHKCAYCFANLSQPDRTMDVWSVSRLLADYPKRKTIAAHLLQQRYPVLVSNVSDPFSVTNDSASLPLLKTMVELDIPVSIQTKGGRKYKEAIEWLPISTWYVSISFLNDAPRKAIEPGAPPIPERLRMVEDLIERGHPVVLGVNPLVPEWLPERDAVALLEWARDVGVHGVWIERLHLNHHQEKELSKREVEALTPGLIRRAKTKRTTPQDSFHLDLVTAIARLVGLQTYSVGQGEPSRFFDAYAEVYPNLFPTSQDWVNHCHASLAPGSIVPFEAFRDFFVGRLPSGVWPIDSYLGSTTRNLWWGNPPPPQMSYKELLSWIWKTPMVKYNPSRLPCFAMAAASKGKDWIVWTDSHGMPYMVFDPAGFPDYCTEVGE